MAILGNSFVVFWSLKLYLLPFAEQSMHCSYNVLSKVCTALFMFREKNKGSINIWGMFAPHNMKPLYFAPHMKRVIQTFLRT